MKRLLPLVVIFIFSCSKQESTTSTSDTTSSANSATSSERIVVQLTPEQVEDIAWAILLKFHDDNLMGDADLMAYIEELAVEGDHILYKLVRHNGDDTGWHSNAQEEEDPPYAENYEEEVEEVEEEAVEETDEERQAREMEEEMAAEEEAREQEYRERYGGPATETPLWYFTNEFDTISYDGHYVAYLEKGTPESAVKTVRIVFTGKMHQQNYINMDGVEEPGEEIKSGPIDFSISDVLVDIGTPLIIDSSQLYLRAKITDLTDQDLAGLSKEQLGYVRNEIFARHGHTFKTPKMTDYFGQKRWYHTIDDDAAPLMNKFEKRNVDFIKKKEG